MSEKNDGQAAGSQPLLRCTGLSRTAGETVILDSVDVQADPGDLLIVTGPSGAGKTSLLRLIAGLDQPTAGAIEIDGRVVSSAETFIAPARRGVGLVFEQAALWPHLTVEQHLELVLKGRGLKGNERKERVGQLLERVRMTSLRHRFPRGLSAGERQRTAVARSLALSPRLLLLDEPLARLDVHLAAELAELLLELHEREGLTTLCVLHRPERVNTPDTRYVILEQGRIVQAGREGEIFREPETSFVAALARTLGY